jgi:hypothetical protein
MDTLAKVYWVIQDHSCHQSIIQYRVTPNEWAIWLDDKKLCKAVKATLRESIQQQRLHKWWIDTRNLQPSSLLLWIFKLLMEP